MLCRGKGILRRRLCWWAKLGVKWKIDRAGPSWDRLVGSSIGCSSRTASAAEDVLITNSVKCRPPNNRFPHAKELEVCKQHWLLRQVKLVNPEVIVLLGRAPLRQPLGEQGTITQLHGQFLRKDGRLYLIQYHPAAALRSPEVRAMMVQDFQKIKDVVKL